MFEQNDFINNQINQLSRQLNELKSQSYTNMNNEKNLNTNGDLKQSTISTMKAKDMIEQKDKFEYLEYEVGERDLFRERRRRNKTLLFLYKYFF